MLKLNEVFGEMIHPGNFISKLNVRRFLLDLCYQGIGSNIETNDFLKNMMKQL